MAEARIRPTRAWAWTASQGPSLWPDSGQRGPARPISTPASLSQAHAGQHLFAVTRGRGTQEQPLPEEFLSGQCRLPNRSAPRQGCTEAPQTGGLSVDRAGRGARPCP